VVLLSTTVWNGADFLLLQLFGDDDRDDESDDESNNTVQRLHQLQSVALFRWLFGNDSPQQQKHMILLVRKDGYVWIMVHRANKDWMKALIHNMPTVGPFTVHGLCHDRNNDATAMQQLWNLSEVLLQNKQHRVAILLSEHERNLEASGVVRAIEHCLQQTEERGRLKLVDAALGITLATAVKEEQEMYFITQACALSAVLVKHGFQASMLDNLDAERCVSHADLADYLLGIFNDPSRVNFRLPAGETYGPCCTPIIQSGGEYDLSVDASNTDKILKDDVVTVSLGTSCEHYCSNIARTFLFNPSASVREIYTILLEMREECLSAMRPGQPLKVVYQAAVDFLSQKEGYEYLEIHLPENLGFGTGLIFRETPLCITASNAILFEDGTTFCVSFAFQNLLERRNNEVSP
jgi:nucleosome binding factor SPN SPT16 subunit